MTPAILVQRIWNTRRGVGTMLAVCTVLVAFAMYAVITSYMEHAPVVKYGAELITPKIGTLCPGDTLTWEQRFFVDAADVPAVLEIDESWYSVDRTIVSKAYETYSRIPLVRPYDVMITVTRTVPALDPGVYWFDHTAQNGHTTAYTVGPVEVIACP